MNEMDGSREAEMEGGKKEERDVIYHTKDRVWPHFLTPRRELKIRRAAEYF